MDEIKLYSKEELRENPLYNECKLFWLSPWGNKTIKNKIIESNKV